MHCFEHLEEEYTAVFLIVNYLIYKIDDSGILNIEYPIGGNIKSISAGWI